LPVLSPCSKLDMVLGTGASFDVGLTSVAGLESLLVPEVVGLGVPTVVSYMHLPRSAKEVPRLVDSLGAPRVC